VGVGGFCRSFLTIVVENVDFSALLYTSTLCNAYNRFADVVDLRSRSQIKTKMIQFDRFYKYIIYLFVYCIAFINILSIFYLSFCTQSSFYIA